VVGLRRVLRGDDLAAHLRMGGLRRDGYGVPRKLGSDTNYRANYRACVDLAAKLRMGGLRRDGYGVR